MGDKIHFISSKQIQVTIAKNPIYSNGEEIISPFSNENNMIEENLAKSNSNDETKITLRLNKSGDEEKTTKSNKILRQSNNEQLNSDIDNISPVKQDRKKNKIKNYDTEDDLYSENYKKIAKNENKLKKCSIIDTDDSETENKVAKYKNPYELTTLSGEEIRIKMENKSKAIKSAKIKTVRKSAKAAMDTINAIKSETQRLHREIHLNVPYHKPKNCTLKEFMSRKSILKPEIGIERNKQFSLKMNEQELINYASFLEKREEEVEELFTNESVEKKIKTNYQYNRNFEHLVKPIYDDFDTMTKNIENRKIIPYMTTNTVNIEKSASKNKLNETNGDNLNNTALDYSKAESFSDTVLDCETSTMEQNINKESATCKVQIISNIQISPAINKPEKEIVKHLKQLINKEAEISNYHPKLNGAPTSIIDLESGGILQSKQTKILSGVEELIERFTNTNFKKRSSKINGKRVEILVCNESNKDRRPGLNFVKLKNNLMCKIKEQRQIEINNKLKHHKEEEEIVFKIFEEEDDEDICENPSSKTFTEDKWNNNEDKFNNADNIEIDELNNVNGLDFKEISDGEADDENEEEHLKIYKIKRQNNKRIIKMIDESSSENEESLINKNFSLKYPLEITEVENPVLPTFKVSIKNLCDTKDEGMSDDEELFDLCSGTFENTPQSQVDYLENKNSKYSKPTAKLNTKDDAGQSSEDPMLPQYLLKSKRKNNIIYSDDEDKYDAKPITKQTDHYDLMNENEMKNIENTKNEDLAATFTDESDENEIQNAVKKNKITKANEYFDQEAEVSESDWSSADEDEKNLDEYDIELGDEDEFDQKKLKDQVGRIHMRKLLDDDARQVKKMQQLFLDDGENDGIGRQRQFRWKKTENEFNLDCSKSEKYNDSVTIDSNDEDEEMWRKMKHEREVILKSKLETDVLPLQIENIFENSASKNLKLEVKTKKSKMKLNEFEKIDSPFLISKSSIKSIRGSFLKRDEEILTKVAGSTTHIQNFNGVSTMQSYTGKNKNFVFSILSQKPGENKRKLSSNSNNINLTIQKKVKLESYSDFNRKKSVIDRLNDI